MFKKNVSRPLLNIRNGVFVFVFLFFADVSATCEARWCRCGCVHLLVED